jgi:N-acetylmuramic acid 6-phosphate etherase
MIQLGKVKGNKMMEMKLSNNKLNKRAIHLLMQELNISNEEATSLIKKHRSIKESIKAFLTKL